MVVTHAMAGDGDNDGEGEGVAGPVGDAFVEFQERGEAGLGFGFFDQHEAAHLLHEGLL